MANGSIAVPVETKGKLVDFYKQESEHKGIWLWLLTVDHKRIGPTIYLS